jgi:hypothetical protein
MEPITAALVAALTRLSEAAISDGYQALKTLLKRKFGDQSDIAVAVEKLEQDPQSATWNAAFDEEVRKNEVSKDDDLRKSVDDLVAHLGAAGVKVKVKVSDQATAQGVIGAGNVNIENMSFGSPKKD